MNLLIPESVKQCFIEKKYYKKYFYKICLEVDPATIKPSNSSRFHRFGRIGLYNAQQNLLRDICNLPINDADCKFRTEGKNISIFTNDHKFIEEVFDKLSARIVEFHLPKSEEHKEVIDQSRQIRVRKRLFDNQFKFKVYFTAGWQWKDPDFSNIKEWLNSLDNTDNTRWSVNSTLRNYFNNNRGFKGFTVAVYLNDPEDLMMCQMRFNGEILRVEEAVLITDL